MESERAHFIQVAHKPIGDSADAAEPPMDGRHDFAEVRPGAGRLVEGEGIAVLERRTP